MVEQLQDRILPASYTAATVGQLIADIHAANAAGGSNTISLTAPTTSPYVLTAVDNATDGPTGLPVIAAHDNLTVAGNGDVIERSAAAGTPAFRVLDVAAGATLTLTSLTVSNGLAAGSLVSGPAVAADGGGIYNQGTLTLSNVTVRNNIAQGGAGRVGLSYNFPAGQDAAGGGIYSGGALALEQGTVVQSDEAVGGDGGLDSAPGGWGTGGSGYGGGVYVAGGTLALTGCTLTANSALGGEGGPGIGRGSRMGVTVFPGGQGGSGYGGGLDVAAGNVTLTSGTLCANTAQGGRGGDGTGGGDSYGNAYASNGGDGGSGYGGGLDLAGGTSTLTGCTLTANSAQGGQGGTGGSFTSTISPYRHAAAPGGNGGNAFGGGMNAAGGTSTLHGTAASGNAAERGAAGIGGSGASNGQSGLGEGGGLSIEVAALVYLDTFTQANVVNNTASASDPNIHGQWTPG